MSQGRLAEGHVAIRAAHQNDDRENPRRGQYRVSKVKPAILLRNAVISAFLDLIFGFLADNGGEGPEPGKPIRAEPGPSPMAEWGFAGPSRVAAVGLSRGSNGWAIVAFRVNK